MSVMKNITRFTAAALAICSVLAVTGCDEQQDMSSSAPTSSNSPAQATTSATTATMNKDDADKIAEIDIGAEKLENGVVKFLSSWDLNPAEGQPVDPALEMFQSQFGGRIEYVNTPWDSRYDKLAVLVQADDSPDMFSAGDMDVFPKGAISGMFDPLDDYVDFSSELWAPMSEVNEQFAFNGRHYVGAVDVEGDCVMFYNKNTIRDNSLDDPAELLAEGKWTWDTFWEMMTKFCDVDAEKYATDGWWFEGGFSLTTGVPYVGMSDGKIVQNLDNALIEKAQTFMLNMNTNSLPLPKAQYNWQVQPKRLADGKTLFYPVGLYAMYPYNNYIQDFADNQEDVMFVPMPKCPEADEYYLPARVSGFSLIKGAKNPKGVAAYLNCAMATRDSEAAVEIGKRQAFEEYNWTQEQWDMYRLVNQMTAEHPVIEMYNAVNSNVADLINNPMKEGYNSGASWTQTRETIRAAVQAELDSANEKLAEKS